MFEILNTALIKLSRHISKVRRDVAVLEKTVERAKEERGDQDDDMDGEATKDEQDLEVQTRKLDELIDFQKNLFLDVLHVSFFVLVGLTFQKCTLVLAEHMERCRKQHKDHRDAYYIWMEGRLNQVFLVVSYFVIRFTIIAYSTAKNSVGIVQI